MRRRWAKCSSRCGWRERDMRSDHCRVMEPAGRRTSARPAAGRELCRMEIEVLPTPRGCARASAPSDICRQGTLRSHDACTYGEASSATPLCFARSFLGRVTVGSISKSGPCARDNFAIPENPEPCAAQLARFMARGCPSAWARENVGGCRSAAAGARPSIRLCLVLTQCMARGRPREVRRHAAQFPSAARRSAPDQFRAPMPTGSRAHSLL